MNETIITITLDAVQFVWLKAKTTAWVALIIAGIYAWYIHYRYKRIEDKLNKVIDYLEA